jgi:hypothetical protein
MPHVGRSGSAQIRSANAAAALVALQGLGLVAAGVFLIVRAVEPVARHRGSTEVLGALSVVAGLGVLAMARAVGNRRPRIRGPLLVLEIICLPIGVTIVQGGRWYVGVPLVAVAIAVVVLMGLAGLITPAED